MRNRYRMTDWIFERKKHFVATEIYVLNFVSFCLRLVIVKDFIFVSFGDAPSLFCIFSLLPIVLTPPPLFFSFKTLLNYFFMSWALNAFVRLFTVDLLKNPGTCPTGISTSLLCHWFQPVRCRLPNITFGQVHVFIVWWGTLMNIFH